MPDISKRFPQNPLLTTKSLKPHYEGFEITGLMNPGVFYFNDKIWMIVRVAERPVQTNGRIDIPFLKNGELHILEIAADDPQLISNDPRVITYKKEEYLTTLSHLRLLCSDNGIDFYELDDYPRLHGEGNSETFGIEDCRVTCIAKKYFLTYTAVSENGVGVGLRTTTDWKNFEKHGMIFSPHNKDCCIFEEKINGKYYALHRPSSLAIGGNYIWLAESTDAIHWGNHQCILKTTAGSWDSARVGAGAAPIKTDKGWLEIYHGADEQHRYCLGAFLMDLHDPSKIIAQTKEPIMIPTTDYELNGFFGNVVFTNGHILKDDGDTLIVYYGAADELICAAEFSIKEILDQLKQIR